MLLTGSFLGGPNLFHNRCHSAHLSLIFLTDPFHALLSLQFSARLLLLIHATHCAIIIDSSMNYHVLVIVDADKAVCQPIPFKLIVSNVYIEQFDVIVVTGSATAAEQLQEDEEEQAEEEEHRPLSHP